ASNYKIRQKALLSANLPLTSGPASKMYKSLIRSFSGPDNLTREKTRVYISSILSALKRRRRIVSNLVICQEGI
ncbi:MAG: hypothetical protein UHU21_00145, partial [Lachnospiraceae bacterium]|nr:hypothetical protein [Lachnospiraceae bacterium]